MTKKFLSVLLTLVILTAALSACTGGKRNNDSHTLVTEVTTEHSTDTTGFKLSYTQADSLNPFLSKTLNNQIVQTLVFDSLFVLDGNFEAQPSIATSYVYENAKTLNVTIPSGIVFSNGSELTANSVVYSFEQAKYSPHWASMLSGIKSATALSSTVVSFKLSYQNPAAHNLLTFAIANGDSDKNGFPIGSGRYVFGKANGSPYLAVNKKRTDFKPHFTQIPLVNIPTAESVDNAINIGNISYAFRDMSSGGDVKMNCSKKAVNLTNLVYIGVNCNIGITANKDIRRAISLAVDRDTIVKSAYRGYAKSATSPFHPNSKLGRNSAIFSPTTDTAAAKLAITQSGVDKDNLKINILTNQNRERIATATLIKQQLESVGFKVAITTVKTAEYKTYVKYGRFDIYIGETRVPSDMNLLSFFSQSGATRYGINIENSAAAKNYRRYLNGKGEIGSFVLAFSKETPFIPLLYKQGMICYSRSLQGDMQGYTDNYFSNIQDWHYN